MPSCSFQKCTNHSGKHKKAIGITFHAFPKEQLWRTKWLSIVRKQRGDYDWIATSNSRVCSIHFKDCDMYITDKGLRRIKKGAVPFSELIYESPSSPEQNLSETRSNSLINLNISDLESSYYSQKKICWKKRICEIESSILNLKKTNQQLTEKCKTFKQIILNAKNKLNISEDQYAELILKAEAADFDETMRKNINGNKMIRIKFTPNLRKFALTLNYYSPVGYKYIRKVFQNRLPHPHIIGKWYENTDALPGFTAQAFDKLRKKVNTAGSRIFCTLIVDEMAIRQQSIWNGKKTLGLVDHGFGSSDTDQVASQVFVMMLVCLNQNWKLPVGYFFVNGLSAEYRANLIKICLTKSWEVGVNIVALTFNGCSSNFNAAQLLGCCLSDVNNLKTTFKHPSCDTEVAIFLDPCHMFKFVRNTLESKKILYDNQNGQIKWQFLANLLKLQNSETLHFANKLTPRHIDFRNQIIKVKLATQLLSMRVATALKLSEQLLLSSRFVNTEATVKFIENFNNLFDIMNSRKLENFGYKKPICVQNKDHFYSFMNEIKDYIRSLKICVNYRCVEPGKVTLRTSKKNVIQSTLKTGFIGFIICIDSLKHLYATLVETKILDYIPMYRLSQDHLEIFFEGIRRQGNINPNATQFQEIYRKVLSHLQLRSSFSDNCIPLDNFPTLNCSSAVDIINRTVEKNDATNLNELYEDKTFQRFKSTRLRVYNQVKKVSSVQVSDNEAEANVTILSDTLDHNWNLSIDAEQIIGYIAGWVARALIKLIKCETCISQLLTKNKLPFHKLIVFKDMGGLCYPSLDLFLICVKSEASIKMFIKENKSQHSICDKKILRAKLNIIKSFLQLDFLSNLSMHSLDQPATFNHRILLLKAIVDKYFDVRLHYIHKTDPAILNTTKHQKRKLSLFEVI